MATKIRSGRRLTTLVVGGGGFIGSHFVWMLRARGDRDVVVAGRGSKPRFTLPNDVRYVQGDAADPAFIGGLLEHCDEVVDLAYATVPKTSFDDIFKSANDFFPTAIIEANIKNTFFIFRCF